MIKSRSPDIWKLNLTTKKTLGSYGYTGQFYQTFKEETVPIQHKLLQKVKKKGSLPNSEVNITWIPKPYKDIAAKEN